MLDRKRPPFGAEVALQAADTAFHGFAEYDVSGASVSIAGDVNGDGYDDILIGANGADPGGNLTAGETYLYYGRPGFDASIALAYRADVTFEGIAANDNSGYSVSGAGDVNGDGYDDILIGAYGVDSGGNFTVGETYLIYGSDTLSGAVSLSTADVTLQGIAANDRSGFSVSGAGDINGDGYDDILIGAYGADPGANSAAGESYVIYGSDTLSAAISLSSADVIFQGIAELDLSGYSVAGAGDVNGDGFGDILIGAYGVNSYTGGAYLILGSPILAGTLSLSSADVTFSGIAASDQSGYSVAGAGDINGDGFDDILIGAWGVNGYAGETYLILGSTTLSGAVSLNSARASFQGISTSDFSGAFVAGAGDVNGDGYDDMLIGAYGTNSEAGETYLFHGSAVLAGTVSVGSADASFQGLTIADKSGKSLSGAGDVNGDSYADILIGALHAEPGGNIRAGDTYLILGRQNAWTGSGYSELSGTRACSTSGAIFKGAAASDISGASVSNAGDVNGDGFDDILIGAAGANSEAGDTYLYYGRPGCDALVALAFEPDAVFKGIAAGDYSGASVSGAGDVNGDGYDDILVGAYRANSSTGETYLIYGNADLSGELSLSSADVTFAGIDADDYSGWSISTAGDVNKDGYDDILIGAYGADPGGALTAGETYLIYGSANLTGAISLNSADVTFAGIVASDESGYAISGAGDVNGDGYDDICIGAFGANSEAGETYLIYGSTTLTGTMSVSSADAIFTGIAAVDRSGAQVSGAGDINGDGYDDILIGAYGAGSGAGATYVIHGSAHLDGTVSLDNADATIAGIASDDYSSWSIAGAGDVNRDGYDDILIGAPWADPGGKSIAGETYLIYGSATLTGSVSLSSADAVFTGLAADDYSGTSVSGAGDIDGDGYDDILIGASGPDSFAGETYLFRGSGNPASRE